jgi:hypothetical protein
LNFQKVGAYVRILDLLVLIVRPSITCEELSLMPDERGWPVLPVEVVFMGMLAGPPRFEATLKLSMPVMCILRVLGLPAIKTWPLLPLMAEPLLPTSSFTLPTRVADLPELVD